MRDVHSNYDSEQATNYDRDREVEEHWHLENRYIEAFFAQRSPRRLLDAPVGTGRFLQSYSRAGEVVGIDASPEMLEVAGKRVQELGLSNIAIQRGDIFSLPFPDGHFDVAVCWRFAHLFPSSQLATALSELARVTKGTILSQAYVQGSFFSRLSSRLLRLPGRLAARLGVPTENTRPAGRTYRRTSTAGKRCKPRLRVPVSWSSINDRFVLTRDTTCTCSCSPQTLEVRVRSLTSCGFSRIRNIAIADCVHYCGFRYGREEFNPYENYVTGLARGVQVESLRDRFEDFIRYYRPRDLGEAIGVITEPPIPLWLLPWKSWRKLREAGGWRESPDDVVDILTYFSPNGVRRSHLLEEYVWLESAWRFMNDGYRPEQHSYITVFELQRDGASRYIVLDGNHRLSALSALGEREVAVRQTFGSCARRNWIRAWPLVVSRHVGIEDAGAFSMPTSLGNSTPFRAAAPATIIQDC